MPDLVDVFVVDAEFGESVDSEEVQSIHFTSMARVAHLACGPWAGEVRSPRLGFLILSGFVIRRVELAGRQSAELLGPGDLMRPCELEGDEYEMVPSHASWQVLSPTRLAVLDERFAESVAAHPVVLERLLRRLLRRSSTLALRLALVQLPNLTARLHLLLWHLADRFGTVEPEGVLLPLPLSHSNLAELVSAQRPSVSRAMKGLEREGLVATAPSGGWLLGGFALPVVEDAPVPDASV